VGGGQWRKRQSDDYPDTLAAPGRRDGNRAWPYPWNCVVAERPFDRLKAGRGGRSQGERREQGDEHGRAAQRPKRS
jgi:hypothetical protein